MYIGLVLEIKTIGEVQETLSGGEGSNTLLSGTGLGCDRAHEAYFLFGIHVLPKDINRTHLPGLFPKQVQDQTTASNEDLQP